MLRFDLIHPPLLEALAASGHGSRVLLADGNFPVRTTRPPSATIIYLNVAPGLLTVSAVLGPLLTAVNVESAVTMQTPDGESSAAEREYARTIGPDIPISRVDRFQFYNLVRSPDVGVIVATADERTHANILLTIGLR